MVEQYNEIVRKIFNECEANKYFESPEYQSHVKMFGDIGLNTFTYNSVHAFLIANYKPCLRVCLKHPAKCAMCLAVTYLHYDVDAFDLFFENPIIQQNENHLDIDLVQDYVLARRGYWHENLTCFTYARLINKELAHFSFTDYPPYRDFCKQYQLQKRASLTIIHETQCEDFARSCAELVFADEYIVGHIMLFF